MSYDVFIALIRNEYKDNKINCKVGWDDGSNLTQLKILNCSAILNLIELENMSQINQWICDSMHKLTAGTFFGID